MAQRPLLVDGEILRCASADVKAIQGAWASADSATLFGALFLSRPRWLLQHTRYGAPNAAWD